MKGTLLIVVTCAVFVCGRDVQERYIECLGEFGCFNSDGIIPVPQRPTIVNTHLNLYTRTSSHSPAVSFDVDHYASHVGQFASVLDSSKDTKVIIHGYLNAGNEPWVTDMTAKLLQKGDFNIMVVDWHGGSRQEYNMAVGDTYLVGAEVAKVLTDLHTHQSLNYSRVHLIGHSLGAQTAGHIGYRVKGIGRITGLDPAEPDFQGKPTDRRLDSSDADFVDVIHTDASAFVAVSGFGMLDPVGDIDFYPNGGKHQPGCAEQPLQSAINNVFHGSVGGAANAIICSHSRAIYLFIESITSQCKFYGHACSSASRFNDGACLGCPAGGCPVMGYDADKTTQRGSFYLSTAGITPFCAHEYYVEIHISHIYLATYGELYITLIGSHGMSEEIKFSPRNEYFSHDKVEKHVIGTNTNIGQVTSLKVRYDEPNGNPLTSLTVHYVAIHSIIIESTEDPSRRIKFCGHEHWIFADRSTTLSSHSGC